MACWRWIDLESWTSKHCTIQFFAYVMGEAKIEVYAMNKSDIEASDSQELSSISGEMLALSGDVDLSEMDILTLDPSETATVQIGNLVFLPANLNQGASEDRTFYALRDLTLKGPLRYATKEEALSASGLQIENHEDSNRLMERTSGIWFGIPYALLIFFFALTAYLCWHLPHMEEVNSAETMQFVVVTLIASFFPCCLIAHCGVKYLVQNLDRQTSERFISFHKVKMNSGQPAE